jgi:RNA-directed DNA polymerase
MKESHDEGPASHVDPESCVDGRKAVGEALTGAHAGQVSSCEITLFGTPTPLSEAEGNIAGGAHGKPPVSPAQSQTLKQGPPLRCMRGNSLHGNRETPRPSAEDGESADRSEKAKCRASDMHGCGESDDRVVPEQPAKESDRSFWSLYERVSAALVRREDEPATAGGRRSTEGNTNTPDAPRTQSRETCASIRLARVQEAARKDKRAKFTALLHHVTVDLLRESFHALKRGAAPGVDGVTWQQYEVGLEDRLANLHRRVHTGTYRAQPSKRAYIPKPDGRPRPLGIAALEDKIVQHAVVTVLNAIYESDFMGFSYGFRRGRSQHDALDALQVGIMGKKVNWVLDVDIRAFFDTIDHEWMMKFLGHRIADPRMLRLIGKWLKAGVSEDGLWSKTGMGTPQGAVASPLLSNVYLHYVLDLWANQWRNRHATGDVIIVRYADDFAMGFQHKHEAEWFLRDLKVRVEQFGLSLHPEKTRLIEFGRFADQNRRKREGRKPETFDFLGFTHICARKHWSGGFIVRRRSIKKRLRAKLAAVKQTLLCLRHWPMARQGAYLRSVVRGFLNYHAVPGNMPALEVFRRECVRNWLKALRRRSQRHRMNWERFRPWVDRLIPTPAILHPYPNDRFYAKHPK